jgi:dienelactone hydrolase
MLAGFVVALMLGATAPAVADDASSLAGRWSGTVSVTGSIRPLSVDFVRTSASVRGVLNVPRDRVLGKPLRDLRLAGGQLSFDVPITGGRVHFDLRRHALQLEGSAISPGGRVPILLTRSGDVPAPPYAVREVRFANGDVVLAGSVLIPPGKGPFPGVVFLHGSSTPQRQDYLFFADLCARHGIAALVYDKRFVGGDLGGASRVSLADLAGDALAAVRALRAQHDVASDEIGLWGNSQGGWVAPLAASESREIAFVITTSGPGVTYGEVNTYADVQRLHRHGAGRDEVAHAVNAEHAVYAYVRNPIDAGALQHVLDAAWREPWARFTTLPHFTPTAQERATWLAWRDLDSDPVMWWRKVRVPSLVVFGAKDDVVPVARSVQRITAALRRAGNRDFTVHVFPGAGHELEAASFPDFVTRWLVRRLHERGQ